MSKNENESDDESGESAPGGSMLDTIEPVGDELAPEQEEPEPEYQKARHEVGQKNLEAADGEHPLAIASGSTGSIKQQVDDEVVLDYLSDKIYGGPDSTIREYLANAETACIRAAETLLKQDGGFEDDDFYTADEEHPDYDEDKRADRQPQRRMFPSEILHAAQVHVGYDPTIEIEWYEADNLLVIQDNGIGFTPREVTDVLAVTGHSGVRDRGDVSGQFGMGVMSAHKMCGKEGSYTLITRTRRNDVPDWAQMSFAAYCYLGGYDQIEGEFPEGSYGSRFELPIQEDLDDNYGSRYADDPIVTKWVGKYAEYMRVPVLYHHFEDGETVEDDEFGDKEFAEDYNGAVLTIDRPEFLAKSYPSASNDTLLLSMPIERNYSYAPPDAPWNVDIRLRNESGVIVEGPNQGLMPVDDTEYESMSDERREQYVRKSDVHDDDVSVPEPDASRDGLQKGEKFWNWLGRQFKELYHSEIARIAASVDDLDDLRSLAADNPNQFSFFMTGMEKVKPYSVKEGDGDEYKDIIESEVGVTFTEDFADELLLLQQSIEIAPRGRTGVSKKRNRKSQKTWKILRDAADGGTVYMGVNVNQKRAEVAWNTHDSNQVARIEKSSHYQKYLDIGWEKLQTVPYSEGSKGADQFSLPDKFKNGGSSSSSSSNAGLSAPNRDLTIRQSSGRGDTTKKSVTEIESILESFHKHDKGNGIKIGYKEHATELVLFPSSTDRNMSDWYNVIKPHDGRACATCINGVYDYLKGTPGIMHIDDLIADSDDVTITTNEGDMTVSDAGDELLIHVVDDEYLERFRDQDVMDKLAEVLHDELEEFCDDFSWDYDESMYPDRFIYAPVDRTAWKRIQPGSFDYNYAAIVGDQSPRNLGTDHTYSFQTDAEIYGKGRFYDWNQDTPEMVSLKSLTVKRDPSQAFALIDTLAILHDNGIKPSSDQNGQAVKLAVEQQASLDDVSSDGGQDAPEHEVLATDGGE